MTPRRWHVAGAGGMLGREVVRQLEQAGKTTFALGRDQMDITSRSSVRAALDNLEAGDVVVNCAAWTAVDDAETHEAEAFAVNAYGAALLAQSCAATGAQLVHISTDYVFAGDADRPYEVDEPLSPRSAYGRTKAAGEWAIRAELSHAWIVRTAWLYGDGPSFVRTMAALERSRDVVQVVTDQHGQPTWTRDLAAQIVSMVQAEAPFGIYHGSASGSTTWHGLAAAVFGGLGADPSRVRPTTSAEFIRPAPRPAYSVLDHSCWKRAGLGPLRPWDEALPEALRTGGVVV